MLHRILIAITAVLWIGPAWADEPTGFAEFNWDTPRIQLVEICRDSFAREPSGEVNCTTRALEIGGDRWSPRLMFNPTGGLGGYQINSRSSGYTSLREIVIAKFGPPHDRKERKYRTRAGQEVVGEVLSWRWPSGTTATLSQLCGQLDTSCLLVTTKQYGEELLRREQEMKEKAKRAF